MEPCSAGNMSATYWKAKKGTHFESQRGLDQDQRPYYLRVLEDCWNEYVYKNHNRRIVVLIVNWVYYQFSILGRTICCWLKT